MEKFLRLLLQIFYTSNLKTQSVENIEFKITGEYIELIQLLKATGLASTGGHAKMIVDEEMVYRNDELETRKRAKILPGETIVVGDVSIQLT